MAAFTNLIVKPLQNLSSTTKLHTFSSPYNPNKLLSFFLTKPKTLRPLSITRATAGAATSSVEKDSNDGGASAKKQDAAADDDDKVKHIHTVAEFEEALREAKQKLVVVEFAARHSKQSSNMYPFMVNLSRTCNDVVFLLVLGDESDETRELFRREKIEKVPHFSFYKGMEKIHDEEGIGPDMLMGDVLYYGDNHSGVGKMLGYMLNRLLVLLLAYAYPAYECFKNVEKNKPDLEQLRFWCQYWILIAAMTVWDPFGDALISWLPMYSEAKLVFCIYLWYPKTKGTKYVYDSFFKPYISKHEAEIDRTLSELKTRAGDSASLYISRVVSYGQTRAFEILQLIMSQSIQRPQPAPQPAAAAPQDNSGDSKPSGAGNNEDTFGARNRLRKTGSGVAR